VLGALPRDVELCEGGADGFVADLVRGNAFGVADLGGQGERPDAELLDERTLSWLLHLRTFTYADRPLIAQHALILVAQVSDYNAGKFADLMNKHEEGKVAWPNKLDFTALTKSEFQKIMIGIFAQNLKALFAPDIDQEIALERIAQWTQKNWWLITEFVKILDRALGPSPPSGEPRLVTQEVIMYVEKRWLRRTQE